MSATFSFRIFILLVENRSICVKEIISNKACEIKAYQAHSYLCIKWIGFLSKLKLSLREDWLWIDIKYNDVLLLFFNN